MLDEENSRLPQTPATPVAAVQVPAAEELPPNWNAIYQDITTGADMVLTAPGYPLHISHEQTSMCALLKSGRFFVLHLRRHDNLVRETRFLAQNMGINVEKARMVATPAEIEAIYQAIPSEAGQSAVASERYIVDLLNQAVDLEATDIHLDIFTDKPTMTVKLRIDTRLTPPIDHVYRERGMQIFNAIYELADNNFGSWDPKSDQAARLMNNDKLRGLGLTPKLRSCRLQYLSANDGNSLAVRIFTDSSGAHGTFNIRNLGWSDIHLRFLEELAAAPHGAVFITGPTGSGKSTTLKHFLEYIDTVSEGTKRILTVEDPVEFTIRGARQLAVPYTADSQERTDGLGAKLRITLRGDPDVIMVGEIRDSVSAQTSFGAAQTGHLVLSTVHANHALGAMLRLADPQIGVQETLLYNHHIVLALVAQRLVPFLCQDCCRPMEAADAKKYGDIGERIAKLGGNTDAVRVRGRGCPHCRRQIKTSEGASMLIATRGAALVGEIVRPDFEVMKRLRLGSGDSRTARDWINEKNSEGAPVASAPIMHHAWTKVHAGLIDPLDAEFAVGRFQANGVAGIW